MRECVCVCVRVCVCARLVVRCDFLFPSKTPRVYLLPEGEGSVDHSQLAVSLSDHLGPSMYNVDVARGSLPCLSPSSSSSSKPV